MYITSGTIENLMEWFDSQRFGPRMICLIVGGNIDDNTFFNELFNKRDALDTISGNHTAIMMFTNKHGFNEVKLLERETPNNYISMPETFSKNLIKSWDKILGVRVSEIRDEYRESVVRASQNVSLDIITYFNLSMSDIPCILFKHKNWGDAIRIETKGMATIKDFGSIIKEISILSEKFNNKTPTWIADELYDYFQNKKDRDILQKEYENRIKNINSYLLEKGVSEDKIKSDRLFELKNFANVFEFVGVNKSVNSSLSLESQQAYRLHFTDENFKTSIRKSREQARTILGYNRSIEQFEKKIKTKGNKTIDQFNESMKEFITDLEAACKKYGFKFRMRRKFKPFVQLLNGMLNTTKKANEFISFQESLSKIITDANKA